jgi:seryl-tRNA synthetase
MPSTDEPPSSPPSGGWSSMDEELRYYKAQYETLEAELQEFQNSSKELEAELERDIEESEKRERLLQEKVESLGFEVNEWQVSFILLIGGVDMGAWWHLGGRC